MSSNQKSKLVGARTSAFRKPLRIAILSLVATLFLGSTVALVPLSAVVANAANDSSTPNRFDPTSQAASIKRPSNQPALSNPGSSTPAPFGKNVSFLMKPTQVVLDAAKGSHFISNDGVLEVDVPPGAITSSEVAGDGGRSSLLVRQIMPASGSNAGSSGHYSFGTFLFQVVDASGHLAGHGLHQHVKLVLHYGKRGSALDIAHTFTVLNGPIPTSVNLDPSSLIALPPVPSAPTKSPSAAPNTASASRTTQASPAAPSSPASSSLGPRSTQLATTNTTTNSLSTTAPMTTASTAVSWGTNAPVATFGKPDPFEVQLSGGSLTTGYPLDLPKGPGGFTPPLSLAYNSAGVNDQHNAQGAAPWVGEGWNMSLGAISWAEHNVLSGTGGAQWEDSWQLSDAFGTSAEIVPPNTNVATYYDDTPNTTTPSPVGWHTVPETHTKIYSYVGPNSIPSMPDLPPCFRVFLTNGVMEEFGCTPGSLQYYPQPCGANTCDYLASWLLDLITDPQGNQIHITYQTDIASGYNAFTYPRDVVLATVEYDSPGCLNAQTACTGSAWTPLMRVNFAASHSVAHVAGSSCAANGNLRCDDPADLSGTGGLAAPTVQSTFVLNDIQTQVRASGTSGWNTLKDYQLAYDQAGPSTITDPVSGLLESTAGKLNLTRLSVVGDDGTTTLPAVNYAYTSQTEYYEDSLLGPTPTTNCGPSWNTACNLWSQTYAGNSSYLSSVSNGLGLAQSFTWQVARDNMHGVNGGGAVNTQNPFYCNGTSVQSSYPCYSADDETWGRAVLTQRSDGVVRLTQAGQGGTQTSTPVTGTTTYNYQLTYPLLAQECADCVAGYSWGNQNDNDYLDFYNSKFMGFAQVSIGNPDGSLETHKFLSTEGWGIYDTAQITCFENPPNPCHNDPWWDLTNAAHGHEYELDRYDANGTTLLQQIVTTYQAVCPAAGVSGSPAVSGYGNWNGNLVSELDLGNPVGVCDIQTKQVDGYTYDGSTSPSIPHLTTTYAYDSYGRVARQADSSNDGGANGSPTSIVHKSSYIWNDAVTTTGTSATGTYLIDFPAFTDIEDSSANRYQCSYTSYDGHGNASGQSTGLTLGEGTRADSYTACGNSGNGYTPSGQISTTSTYDSYGNQLTSTDPDANAGNTAHQGCTVGSSTYSACTTYDGTFDALATAQANALNQTTHTNYQAAASGTAAGGFGLWPVSTSDVNTQTALVTYDALGRMTGETLPGEANGLTTVGMAYTVWCSGSSAQSACVEIDRTQRLNSTTTATFRSFYDGLGRLVETRSPAPGMQDVVQYYYYDPSQRPVFKSTSYFVTAYTGAPGFAAYSIPDSTQAGSSYTYDGIGRTTLITDALSNKTSAAYTIVCSPPATGDNACYEQVATVDALGHQAGALADAFRRTNYEQRYMGNSTSNYAVYATSKYTYDYAGDLTQILQPDGASKITYQFDMAGHNTAMTDPDRGSETYTYDQNGNLTQSTDARGASGTVYAGFDGIDRPIWANTTNSPTGAFDAYIYDSSANGNVGIGRLTSETFSDLSNNSLNGSYRYVYDVRGRQISSTLTIGSTNYPLQTTYDDASSAITQTYPDGETVTNAYGSQDWLSGVSTSLGSTTLLSGATYSGTGGANGYITNANLAGATFQYSAGFDLLARATDLKVKRASDQATMFDETRTFDASGNVSTASTTLSVGTDSQAFCYDEQNRLTWAGSIGTPPCTGTPVSAGTLTSAQYTQTFVYDVMGRLTTGPSGAYSYGNGGHVHAVTAIGGTYTAAYDAAGDMTCRAPSALVTCNGTQTGAQFNYNNQGQLAKWQDQPSSPTSTATFLYDGQGNRVVQQASSGGSQTTTVYVGGFEADATTGSTTTKTSYYYANGQRFASALNGSFSYLATDGLGSASAVLNGAGNATASVLYAPYGLARFSSGTMPTDYGYTGQHSDSTSGLDYYGTRYYDPVAAEFTSPDSVLPGGGFDVWGLSRYAYVEGNPVMHTDPTGQMMVCECSDAAGNTGNPASQPVAWNPFSWNWSTAVQVAQTQIAAIRPQNQDLVNGVQDWVIQTGQGVEFAASHPVQTALSNAMCGIEMAQCLTNAAPGVLDTKDLSQGNYAKWAGHEIPNVLLIAATAGVAGLAGRALLAPAEVGVNGVDDVLANPGVLQGQSPGAVRSALGDAPNWQEETLGQGSHGGQGWVFRQYDANGNPTGRVIRWHPGGGRHGPDPYWRVSSPEGGKSGIIAAGPDDRGYGLAEGTG